MGDIMTKYRFWDSGWYRLLDAIPRQADDRCWYKRIALDKSSVFCRCKYNY